MSGYIPASDWVRKYSKVDSEETQALCTMVGASIKSGCLLTPVARSQLVDSVADAKCAEYFHAKSVTAFLESYKEHNRVFLNTLRGQYVGVHAAFRLGSNKVSLPTP